MEVVAGNVLCHHRMRAHEEFLQGRTKNVSQPQGLKHELMKAKLIYFRQVAPLVHFYDPDIDYDSIMPQI